MKYEPDCECWIKELVSYIWYGTAIPLFGFIIITVTIDLIFDTHHEVWFLWLAYGILSFFNVAMHKWHDKFCPHCGRKAREVK